MYWITPLTPERFATFLFIVTGFVAVIFVTVYPYLVRRLHLKRTHA